MLSINTNLPSLTAQRSLTNSTKLLNQAIERMSTGFKINHASDNAANYSISTNMTTKLGAYQVAEDNVASGMDLVSTAGEIISLMQDKAARLSALSTQARNGTYGAQSLEAINSEANAIVSEIMRLYETSQYNGVSLFNQKSSYILPDGMPKAGESGFIDDPKTYTDAEVAAMTKVADATTFTAGQKYSISTVAELEKLATMVNSGANTTNVEFVLGSDIDLSSISNWTPIGNSSKPFNGIFDGNGHVIRNLKISNETADYQGLFGYTNSPLRNIGLENVDVKGRDYVAGLVGYGFIRNCYVTGTVSGQNYVGGLAGAALFLTKCYATVTVSGEDYVGGLAAYSSNCSNCYATGNVTGQNDVGGLVGGTTSDITNSYATGAVTGSSFTGGLVGMLRATSGTKNITNSAAYGSVNGTDTNSTGSFIGGIDITHDGTNFGTVNITNSLALPQDMNAIGGCYKYASSTYTLLPDYDMSSMLAGIQDVQLNPTSIILQVGINGDESCQIEFDTNFRMNLSSINGNIQSDSAYQTIQNFTNLLSEKATALGAVENRLESALESIAVNIDNLTSSRSTLRDADIAEVSSEYIRQQILQQASATLLATANQSPALALQLL